MSGGMTLGDNDRCEGLFQLASALAGVDEQF